MLPGAQFDHEKEPEEVENPTELQPEDEDEEPGETPESVKDVRGAYFAGLRDGKKVGRGKDRGNRPTETPPNPKAKRDFLWPWE